MVYVKSFDVLGIDSAQIPCIELQGVPNAATVGAVGLLGMDMTSEGHEIYKCVAVNGSVYTWECLTRGKDGTSVVKADMVGDDLVLTLSDGSTINAGKVKGADGKDGLNGKDGKDGCEITNITISDKNELLVETSDGKVINAGVLPTVKGDAGVSVVKAEFNESGDLVLTLSSGELLTVGHVIPTLQDWLGKWPIGDESHYIYYDGEKFVSRAVSIKDETTEWAQIALMSEKISKGEKTPEELGLAVGQERTITLTTGEEVTFVILGFNHDDLADGSGKAGITFGMKNLLATKYAGALYDDEAQTDWVSSYLKGVVLASIYYTLPDDLRHYVKLVKKEHLNAYDVKGFWSNDYLFLFSFVEIGYSKYGVIGSQYDYYPYNTTSNVIKYTSNGVGSVSSWWVRDMLKGSGDVGGPSVAYRITKDGEREQIHMSGKDDGDWNITAGICFGFCI